MPRGRKPDGIEKISWHVKIPVHIAGQYEILFADPVTGKTKYGVRNQLITRLLSEHLDKLKRDPAEQQRMGLVNKENDNAPDL